MSAQFYLSLLNPAIALAFSAIVALLWRRWPNHAHFLPLSIAFLYLGLAFITQEWPLFSQPGAINYAGNAFFYAAVVLACISALVRVRTRVPVIGFAGISLIAVSGFAYFAWVEPSTLIRILLLNGCFAALTILTIIRLVAAGIRDLADRLFVAGVALGAALAIGRPVLIIANVMDINPGGPLDESAYWGSVAGLTPLLAILVVAVFAFALVLEIVVRLTREAERDHLTGLLNRRGFETAANEALGSAPSGQALLIADIDDFKQVNDRFGHAVGDRVIATVGTILSRQGESDFAGRIGGEEFALFYRETTVAQLERLASRIAEELARQRISGLPDGYPLTISIGLHRRDSAESLDDMLILADRALYRAKSSGKNRAVLSPTRLKAV